MDNETTTEDFRMKLKSLLDEYGKSINSDGVFVTGYAIVAEFFDGNGDYWSTTIYEDKVPVWHITGLMQHALENDFGQEEGEE